MISAPMEYERLIWKYGRRVDYWISYAEFVGNFIVTHKIPAIEKEHLLMDDPAPVIQPKGAKESIEAVRIRPYPPFPGGLKCAHLHFRGDLYLLTDKQWKEFSGAVVKDFQDKLGAVKTVAFDQLIGLSEAISGLG